MKHDLQVGSYMQLIIRVKTEMSHMYRLNVAMDDVLGLTEVRTLDANDARRSSPHRVHFRSDVGTSNTSGEHEISYVESRQPAGAGNLVLPEAGLEVDPRHRSGRVIAALSRWRATDGYRVSWIEGN